MATQKLDADQLLQHLFNDIAKATKDRNGGYTRVLKLGKRQGDATEMAILQFVDKINNFKIKAKPAKAKPAKEVKPVKASEPSKVVDAKKEVEAKKEVTPPVVKAPEIKK